MNTNSNPNPKRRVTAKLGKRHERWLYSISTILLLSGVGWLIAHYFFAPANEFGEAHNASEPWWMYVHGAAVMGFLIVFGSLLPVHISAGWSLRKNRLTGVVMISFVGVLILTGWALYYAGNESFRAWVSVIHWIIGIVCALGLFVHVRIGKRIGKSATKNPG